MSATQKNSHRKQKHATLETEIDAVLLKIPLRHVKNPLTSPIARDVALCVIVALERRFLCQITRPEK